MSLGPYICKNNQTSKNHVFSTYNCLVNHKKSTLPYVNNEVMIVGGVVRWDCYYCSMWDYRF